MTSIHVSRRSLEQARGGRQDGSDQSPLGVARAHVFAKTALDMIVTIMLLALLAPTLLVVAIAIRLDSPGPVLFVQERWGVRARRIGRRIVYEPATFRFYKFRSMISDADAAIHRAHIERYLSGAAVAGDENARFKLGRDPRVTGIGRLIRRTSLDELPQLFNVLRRDMSLVGPRPVPLYEGEYYLEHVPERFGALPGLTGLWQVSGRCDLSSKEMLDLDLEYVRRQSIGLDLKVLLRTVPAVVTGRGAA